MSETQKKPESQHRKAMDYTKTTDPFKAIFTIKEIFHEGIYQTRGVGCAVNVGGSVRLMTWRGVIGEIDCSKSVIMDRFSEKSTKDFLSNINRYRLKKSTIKENGRFAYISAITEDGASYTSLDLVPRNDIQATDFSAYTFSGKEKLELNFKYDKSEKKHTLIIGDWKNRTVLEKSSVIGSPIVVDEGNNRKVVVGVVGERDGELTPIFVTEEELHGQERIPSEGINSNSSKHGQERNPSEVINNNSSQHGQSSSGAGAANFVLSVEQNEEKSIINGSPKLVTGHEKNPKGMNGNPCSEEKESVPSTDAPDANFGSVAESSEKVRSGTVPVQYLPYLALDIQGQVAWKSFGHSLLEDPELNGIEKDNDEDYERCYKMLKRCHQRGIATYKVLADALQDHGLDSIREEYCLEGHDPPTRSYPKNLNNVKPGSVTIGDLHKIALAVKGKRQRLGRALGIADDQLDEKVEENRQNVSEQSYQILRTWKSAKGRGATYNELAQALLDRTVMLTNVMTEHCLASKSG